MRMIGPVHEIVARFDSAVELSGVGQLELSELRRINGGKGGGH